MDYNALAALLFPDVSKTPEYYENLYPERNLTEGARVTRFAPSPTGFVHFGGLYPVVVCERLAHQSGGVFYLRIEDTDSKREVEGAEYDLIKVFEKFGINFDESIVKEGKYGPYRQSERREIYRTYAKELVKKGKAYPCFCTEEDMRQLREKQEALKLTPGYYGEFVKCRDLTLEQVKEKLDAGAPYTLRFRSDGNPDKKIKFTDLVKGTIEVTENHIDHVLLKSDGMPTYHLAHAVDDHLMRTTHVVRGEEWLSSLPYHIQLFSALGFKLPKYLHISQLMRKEGDAKKKLSKRDKGAGMSYYISEGYPAESVIEYVMTLLNSNFEDWRRANPTEDINSFPFSVKKMSPSGSLFDLIKLGDVSKNVISRMTAEDVYNKLSRWAEEFDREFYDVITLDPDYTKLILQIGRGGSKPRKDLETWKDAKGYMGFFFSEYFEFTDKIDGFNKDDIIACLDDFALSYNIDDEQDIWFSKVKEIGEKHGFCPNIKEYKANPENWKGSVGDVSSFIRIAVTGKLNSPDLCAVMKILGKEKSIERINKFKETL
ncbi:MAG TPA: glutamate--tRNA ligase [Ruminococcaceae bacterium]|nr:glutamate--tRNA ligase [Oscillospiraceae bacterium]